MESELRKIECGMQDNTMAFTLIELLVVVLILAILSTIAVSSFVDSQVRAKVVASRNNQRVSAGAIEAYKVDHNSYLPEPRRWGDWVVRLTTPAAYLASMTSTRDPFESLANAVADDDHYLLRYPCFAYRSYTDKDFWKSNAALPRWHRKFGCWALEGLGPESPSNPSFWPYDADGDFVDYDATNGTTSQGIIRHSQRQ